jgi:hypothetical protein
MTKRARRLVIISLVVWVLCLAAYVVFLTVGHALGDLGCEYPAGSSLYGHASWQWWTPGTRCTYTERHIDSPSWASGIAVMVLILWPAATWFVGRRR